MPSSIQAGNNLNINATNQVNNGTIAKIKDHLEQSLISYNTIVDNATNQTITNIINSGTLNPLTLITLPQGNYGIFRKPADPNSHYLFETNPNLIDTSKFLGSDYFLNRLGIDTENMAQKFLGDAYFDNQILTKTLQDQAIQNMYEKAQQNGETNLTIEQRIENMYKTISPELQAELGLVVGEALTEEQLDKLDQDIVWYVKQDIDLGNGHVMEDVLVAQVFLSKQHRELLQQMQNNKEFNTTTSLIAGNNISINTQTDLTNSNNSVIIARNNLSIRANNINNIDNSVIRNINSTYNTLDSMNNIIITQNSIFELIAGDTINNIGSQIQANTNGNATIYAENNINNETTKVRINQGGNNYTDIVRNTASISNTGNGNLIIQANNGDITNTGANISANGSIGLQAGNDIIFNTLELESYYKIETKKKKKKSSTEIQTLTNIGSNITSGNGSIVMIANNDIHLTSISMKADKDINLQSTNGNIIIDTAQDIYEKTIETTKKGSFGRKKSTKETIESSTNVLNNIQANNLAMNSKNDIDIIGSNFNIKNDVNLTAGNDVNILSTIDQSSSYKETNKKGMGYRTNSINENLKMENKKTTFNVGNNFMVNSGNNINFIGVDVNAYNGSINAGNEFNLFSVQDYEYNYNFYSKQRKDWEMAGIGAAITLAGALLMMIEPNSGGAIATAGLKSTGCSLKDWTIYAKGTETEKE